MRPRTLLRRPPAPGVRCPAAFGAVTEVLSPA